MGLNRLRVFTAAAAVVVLMAGVGGCAATPEPEPTPTPLFASEEEAFEAAEEVYRAYVEADNEVLAGIDGADPQRFLQGAALDDAISAKRFLEQEGLTSTGRIEIISFRGQTLETMPGGAHITAHICLDSSGVHTVDTQGQVVSDAEPTRIFAATALFVADPGEIQLAEYDVGGDHACD